MAFVADRSLRNALFLAPVAMAIMGYGISLLPSDLIIRATSVLAGWLMLSIPVGVLVGHFALNEDWT
jgi:hypothetical protein